jgi:CspA family cold shock protein
MAEYLIGQVKWFNRKAGYGFIHVLSSNQDVFVHHSGIVTKDSIFKYLVDGETVRLRVVATTTDHRSKAVDVQAVEGATLMCELHFEQRKTQNEREQADKTNRYSVKPSGDKPPRREYRGAKNASAPTNGEWVLTTEQALNVAGQIASLAKQAKPRK